MELLLPRVVAPARILPSYVKLDMAFGVGAGTTLYDKSRYRSHGAIVGADWAAGLHGYALNFTPSNFDHVEIPAAKTQLNFTSGKFSIVMRVRFDSFAGNPILFQRGWWNTDGYQFYALSTGRLFIYTYQAAANQSSNTVAGTLVTATWYTLGLSRNGASIRLFINGIDRTAGTGTHVAPLTSARSAKIGISDDLISSPLDAKMEFLRIFGGVALSASEQLAWHNALK